METHAIDGAEQDLEWESGSDSGDEEPRRAVLYDRTTEMTEAWSDGDGEAEEDGYDDMDVLR